MKINNLTTSVIGAPNTFQNKESSNKLDGKLDGVAIKNPEDEIARLKKQIVQLQATIQEKNADTIKGIKPSDPLCTLLASKPYKDISKDDGFKMLGYFTEKCYKDGYPWKLFKPDEKSGELKNINVMEACERLSQGEKIIMQPMRKMDVNLSASEIGVLAGAVNPASALASSMMYLSTTTPMSHELKLGPSIYIRNFGELKLLKELYDPALDISDKMQISTAANNLSKFLYASSTSNAPWKILKNDSDTKISDIIKGSAHKSLTWGAYGAGVGVAISGVLGAVLQNLLHLGWTGIAIAGATAGLGAGIAGAVKGRKEVLKGKEINAFEALDRVLENKPIIIQKREVHGIGVPILGTINFFKDYGEPNSVSGAEQLKSFANILENNAQSNNRK